MLGGSKFNIKSSQLAHSQSKFDLDAKPMAPPVLRLMSQYLTAILVYWESGKAVDELTHDEYVAILAFSH